MSTAVAVAALVGFVAPIVVEARRRWLELDPDAASIREHERRRRALTTPVGQNPPFTTRKETP